MYKVFGIMNGEFNVILVPTKEIGEMLIAQNPEWHMNPWGFETTVEK